jgi:hypothetical protein
LEQHGQIFQVLRALLEIDWKMKPSACRSALVELENTLLEINDDVLREGDRSMGLIGFDIIVPVWFSASYQSGSLFRK